MADGQVQIQTRLDSSNIRRDVEQTNRELSRVGSNMGSTAREMRNTFGSEFTQMNRDIARGYTQVSQAHMDMMNEMKNASRQQKAGMQAVREAQIEAQYGFFQLGQQTGNYTGSVNELISQANSYGKAMKSANDQAMNSNRMYMQSMLQTIGAMNNMSSMASRVQNNLTVMNNPLYSTARLALHATDALDRLARSGSPQQLALEFLGANASVKQYNDFIRDLNAKMMHMPIVFGLATAGAVKFYGALHGSVMKENTQYAEAFNNMLEKLAKAFEPMRQAFAAVMIPMYNFIAKIAEMVIAFNEAHPTIAKFIQGMLMIVPALMVVMTPLALGIGYFKGLRAILFALRPIMMPIITMFATMSAPVWILAAAISGLVVGFTHFYKTSETFRNAVNGCIEAIKNFGTNMLNLGKFFLGVIADGDTMNDWFTHLPESWQGVAEAIGQVLAKISNSITGLFPVITQFGQNLLNLGRFFVGVALDGDTMNDWFTHLPATWQPVAESIGGIIATMSNAITGAFPVITQFGQNLANLSKFFLGVILDGDLMNDWFTHLPASWQPVADFMGSIILNMVTSIKTSILSLVEAFKLALGGDTSQLGQIFMTIMPTLISLLLGGLPALLITAARFLPTIVEGMNTMLPILTSSITNIITSTVTLITTYLPEFLNKGIEILTKVIEGIVQVLPQIVTTIVNVVTTMINSWVNTVGVLLPLVLDAGIKILMAVIDGIVKSLPAIIDACIKVINKLVESLVSLLPKIIDAGIKILMALIDGIIKVLPQLIQTAILLITKLCDMILQNLPKLLDAGMKILMELIKGIIKILPDLINAGIKIIIELVRILIDNLPKIWQAGMKILQELIKGIIQILPQLISTALKLIVEIVRVLISNLPQIWRAGMQILAELIKGILSLIGQLLSTITGKVIGGITKCFSDAGNWLVNAGKNIIQGLINGITGMVGKAVSAVKKVGSSIKDGIADFFDIHSPSRLMYGMGEFVTEGLANGIVSLSSYAVKETERMANAIIGAFDELGEDIALGDFITGSMPDIASLTSGSIKLPPIMKQATVTGVETVVTKKNVSQDSTGAGSTGDTYIVMDKKIVGEVLAQPVETTNNRRKQRLAQFKPTVTPSF
ncbi:carbamoyl-phosphate synthase [Bacillus mycoides]|uniref:carbamoyl-phosphate synthase n=1 Tax=Bacillus mycoides TaxID=1405 RepID=UPI001C02AAA1|nr:carbamoyl-phosphate synthase [Bacillus mycoides]QWI52523.1 carbamoyl-phosphate synthase [Bacillus mycoides]